MKGRANMQVVSKASRLEADPSLARTLDELIMGVRSKDPSQRHVPAAPAEPRPPVFAPTQAQAQGASPHAIDRLGRKERDERSAMLRMYKERAQKELARREREAIAAAETARAASKPSFPMRSKPYENPPYIPLDSLLDMIGDSEISAFTSHGQEAVGRDGLTDSERGLLSSLAPKSAAPTLSEAIRAASDAVESSKKALGHKMPMGTSPVTGDDAAIAPAMEPEPAAPLSFVQPELNGAAEQAAWDLDMQFMQWLHARCMSFMDRNLCSDVYVEFEGKVMSQRHALEVICGDALFAINNHLSQDESICGEVSAREQRAARLWAEILPDMWHEPK